MGSYPVNARVPQGSTLGPALFPLYINDVLDVICDIAIYADNTLCSMCDQVSDMWQQLELNLIYKALWTGAGSMAC